MERELPGGPRKSTESESRRRHFLTNCGKGTILRKPPNSNKKKNKSGKRRRRKPNSRRLNKKGKSRCSKSRKSR